MGLGRILDLATLAKRKSFFLLGPRATGKSYLVREQLAGKATVIDLLRSDVYLRLSAEPSLLESLIPGGRESSSKLVVVDEVQTGLGRTGKMFGHQHSGAQPDWWRSTTRSP